MTIVLYPGSFDPPTLGHIDIIARASRLFDRVIVTIARNSAKSGLFTPEERMNLLIASVHPLLEQGADIEIRMIDGLLAEFARDVNASAIVRGLRTHGDFEYELQMAVMNRRLHGSLETVFIPADERYAHLSSTIVKEVARYGVDISDLVPEPVVQEMRSKVM